MFLEGLQEPYRSQSLELIRENVKHVDAFISVSEYYAGFVPDYLGIPREKIHVVPLGINLEGYEKRERDPSQPFTIGFFARVAPEKGLACAGGGISEAAFERFDSASAPGGSGLYGARTREVFK